ncbi:hypothetical protein A2U01_0094865, partial [Trifolium medium]|nr:hypothetical protein [Trifolium medium]
MACNIFLVCKVRVAQEPVARCAVHSELAGFLSGVRASRR